MADKIITKLAEGDGPYGGGLIGLEQNPGDGKFEYPIPRTITQTQLPNIKEQRGDPNIPNEWYDLQKEFRRFAAESNRKLSAAKDEINHYFEAFLEDVDTETVRDSIYGSERPDSELQDALTNILEMKEEKDVMEPLPQAGGSEMVTKTIAGYTESLTGNIVMALEDLQHSAGGRDYPDRYYRSDPREALTNVLSDDVIYGAHLGRGKDGVVGSLYNEAKEMTEYFGGMEYEIHLIEGGMSEDSPDGNVSMSFFSDPWRSRDSLLKANNKLLELHRSILEEIIEYADRVAGLNDQEREDMRDQPEDLSLEEIRQKDFEESIEPIGAPGQDFQVMPGDYYDVEEDLGEEREAKEQDRKKQPGGELDPNWPPDPWQGSPRERRGQKPGWMG